MEYTNVITVMNKYGKINVAGMAQELSHTSNLKNKLRYLIGENGAPSLKYIMPAYGQFVLSGRKPGSKMPPSGSLDTWLNSKGISHKFDFVIRRAIGRDGIKAIKFDRVIIKNMPIFIDELGPALAADLAIELQKQIDDN